MAAAMATTNEAFGFRLIASPAQTPAKIMNIPEGSATAAKSLATMNIVFQPVNISQ